MKENRETFFARLRQILAPSELNMVMFSYMTAKTVHRGQLRKEMDEHGQRIRYFEHLRRCALIMIVEIRCKDPKAVCMMILHDTVEDTDLDPVYIEQFLGADVARGVLTLSKHEDESDEEYAERLQWVDDWTILLGKLCDTLDNLRTLHACAPGKQGPKIAEVETLRFPIFEKLLRIAPPEYRETIRTAFDEVRKIVDDYKRDGSLPKPPYTPPE